MRACQCTRELQSSDEVTAGQRGCWELQVHHLLKDIKPILCFIAYKREICIFCGRLWILLHVRKFWFYVNDTINCKPVSNRTYMI